MLKPQVHTPVLPKVVPLKSSTLGSTLAPPVAATAELRKYYIADSYDLAEQVPDLLNSLFVICRMLFPRLPRGNANA